ncbi:T9SS C-terminal target domain-containing protein, partial [Segetibacter aerophilus]|uniref:T9SS C-terminal target domain-containing protein n=1 Tax=Segetibacter aerophilus TaxID=670293 RepID=UPI0011BD9146
MKKAILTSLCFTLMSFSFAQFAVTPLSSIPIASSTGQVPQAKVWTYASKHWCILASADGLNVWRLDGTVWVKILNLASGSSAKPDVKVVGNVAHIFVYKGTTSVLYSIEYDVATGKYKNWAQRTSRVEISLDAGIQTGTIDIDGTGKMWLASDAKTTVNVRWSAPPYSTWSAPISIGAGVLDSDLCAVVALPGKIGLLWSNQATKKFLFRTHSDTDPPSTWSAEETPGYDPSLLNIGKGLANNFINTKAAPDGKLFCAIKTNYNTPNQIQNGLLVRQANGSWDPVYAVTLNEGTTPIVLLNPAINKVKVVYTASNGNIVYRESSTSSISFGPANVLISGVYDNSTSVKETYGSDGVVVLASNATQAVGILGYDNQNV